MPLFAHSSDHPAAARWRAWICFADTDAKYQYRLTQIVLAYTISAPK